MVERVEIERGFLKDFFFFFLFDSNEFLIIRNM